MSITIRNKLVEILTYRSLPVTLIAVCIFMCVLNCKVSFGKFWKNLAAESLVIYIVHENFVWYSEGDISVLWNKIFHIDTFYSSNLFPLYLVGLIVLVVCLGWIVGKITDIVVAKLLQIRIISGVVQRLQSVLEEIYNIKNRYY